jgi:hypothetical protein
VHIELKQTIMIGQVTKLEMYEGCHVVHIESFPEYIAYYVVKRAIIGQEMQDLPCRVIPVDARFSGQLPAAHPIQSLSVVIVYVSKRLFFCLASLLTVLCPFRFAKPNPIRHGSSGDLGCPGHRLVMQSPY